MGELTFSPFYERPADWFPGYLIGKLVVAATLGGAFLAAHYWAIGPVMFADWSWFLGPLIIVAMIALYYATDTLRGLLPEMSLRLRGRDGAQRDRVFMGPLHAVLSDRYFVLSGLFFGVLNALMGDQFGIPYETAAARITMLAGFFLAGFVCGMAVLGILGVTCVVACFSRHARQSLDYLAPDHCGGVQFIGEGLVVFSSVTLVAGVMISIFIREFHWTSHGHLVVALQWVWIGVPYVFSLLVLIGPAVPLNDVLRRYKVEQEAMQLHAIAEIERRLGTKPRASARKDLRDELAYEQNVRKELHAMGTWPHGMSANLKYLGIFAANLLASASTAFSLLGKLH